jgi:hypothetical protein
MPVAWRAGMTMSRLMPRRKRRCGRRTDRGALLGAIGDHDTGIFAGALIGLVLGLFAVRWTQALVERLNKLEARVEMLARAVAAEDRDVAAARPTPATASPIVVADIEPPPPTADAMPADTLARTEAERLPA